MCVDAARSGLLSRPEFFAGLIAAASPLIGSSRADAQTGAYPAHETWSSTGVALPPPPARMSPGNAQAAAIAANSPFVLANYAAIETLARTIGDVSIRTDIFELLHDPSPRYADFWNGGKSGHLLIERLVAAGLAAPETAEQAIFPARGLSQPFWSAPGSSNGSHHAYPGGLVVHERFNAELGMQTARTYDRVYFSGRHTVDTDITIAAAIYHDVMKTNVFSWNDDGTISGEAQIGGTGAHHVLSGAEAIVRGRPPRLVIAILSAHAAPSLGDEAKVVTWCRAAALVANVDPVAYGLLRKTADGFALAPTYVPVEAFVNFLSDHDYVLSVHAFGEVAKNLRRLAPRYTATASPAGLHFSSEAWFRNAVLARTSAIALYEVLASRGEPAFDSIVERSVYAPKSSK